MKIAVPSTVMNIGQWLNDQGAIVAISLGNEDIWEIDYVWAGKIQPTIKIPESGRIVFPRGSDFDLVMRFLAM